MDLRSVLLVSIFGIILLSCDKGVDPFDENGNTNGPDTSSSGVVQKVLLEDLTGFRCTNCPQAHSIADNLADIYGDQLIIVGVHCSLQFAFPTGDNESEPYHTDFRTEAGEAYYEQYGMPGLPTGLVNRRIIDNSAIIAPADWAETVVNIIAEEPQASVKFTDVEYDAASRDVSFNVEMETLTDLEVGQYFLTLYLTEDSIYDWQLNNGVDIEDYLHRHVLRDNINGTWGELAFSTGAGGQQNSLNFNYTLDEAWNEEHCEVVGYIYNGDTREIVQANKVYVTGE